MRAGAVPHSIFAREDSPVGHDDATRRAWYQAWSEYMQRPASDPWGEPGRVAPTCEGVARL